MAKVKEFYGQKNLNKSGDYTKIINKDHFERIDSYLNQNHGGQVIFDYGKNKD